MNIMTDKRKRLMMTHDYDYQHDSLFMYRVDDYEYERSLFLEDGLILDLDKDNTPTALEIINASKRLNVDKFSLRMPFGFSMDIDIEDDYITISATFKVLVRNKPVDMKLNVNAENNINIPSQEIVFERPLEA